MGFSMEFSSSLWLCPFLGIILSMSFGPLLWQKFWHRYASYVPLFWSLIYLFFVWRSSGISEIVPAVFEPIVADYLPFVILIATLYVTSGGIFVDFPRWRGPMFNTLFLFFSSTVAGWIGTTGASALLIRPFLRANSHRKYRVHLMVFFIFLVANIGGGVSPIGDPPLFIGFLKGIDFFWFIQHLYPVIFGATGVLCALFFLMDSLLFRMEQSGNSLQNSADHEKLPPIVFRGLKNVLLMVAVLSTVIFCNFKGEFALYGHSFSHSSLIRNCLLVVIALISLRITPDVIHKRNGFSLLPLKEVAELFAGIFITVTPIINMLNQGSDGIFRPVFEWIAPGGAFLADRCFWASGLLSSVLDNAPTFLIFFYLTSGDPQLLMTTNSHILAAFSISTVFMGALTYIGNAPNLMVRSISSHYGIKTPSFLGYLLWSVTILAPLFFVISRSLSLL
ncbi:MAG: sodium:proton antiporter [Holosporaceae bacterium]|jgi:Na+/H+ antiporter NhaD/arsenite permease-like protein|nr:sodium:proton antiporter [Holosporaceae bacterium]